MHKLVVAVIASSRQELESLVAKAEGRNARVAFETSTLPVQPEEPAVKQLQELEPEVIAVSVDVDNPEPSLAAIRLLRSNLPTTVICAVGAIDQLHTIVRTIREGAADFMDRKADPDAFQDGFARLACDVLRSSKKHGNIITFVGAKGGCGATTLAVNTALAMQDLSGSVVLVDLAPHAHAALHPNVAPGFGVSDALANLERMDKHLLDSFTVLSLHGLRLLAGITYPMASNVDPSELLALFDLLATRYDQVVVDCSGRADQLSRSICYASSDVLLVSLPNVTSLWSARRAHDFLSWEIGRERVNVILNRCHKVNGRSLEDALQAKIAWQVPDGGDAVAESVECGTPIVLMSKPEVARSIRGFAETLLKQIAQKGGRGERPQSVGIAVGANA